MKLAGPITPCLWFDTQVEDAAKFYCGIFEDSRIKNVCRFTRPAATSTARKPAP